jgi:hypothetical protein
MLKLIDFPKSHVGVEKPIIAPSTRVEILGQKVVPKGRVRWQIYFARRNTKRWKRDDLKLRPQITMLNRQTCGNWFSDAF